MAHAGASDPGRNQIPINDRDAHALARTLFSASRAYNPCANHNDVVG
jgi:hypothetical protein